MVFLIQGTFRKILAEDRSDAGNTASDSFFVEVALIACFLPRFRSDSRKNRVTRFSTPIDRKGKVVKIQGGARNFFRENLPFPFLFCFFFILITCQIRK